VGALAELELRLQEATIALNDDSWMILGAKIAATP
jgi:hypothetical protein